LFICGADARSQHTDFSGGDSPLTAGSPENSGVVERRFADEPLYQFYTAGVVEVSKQEAVLKYVTAFCLTVSFSV
jgi:hypothetical protein